jgi:hypothetical protein
MGQEVCMRGILCDLICLGVCSCGGAKDPMSCTRVNVQDAGKTGTILNSSPYTPIQAH